MYLYLIKSNKKTKVCCCSSGVPVWALDRPREEEKTSYRIRVRTETSEETRSCCKEGEATGGKEKATGRTKLQEEVKKNSGILLHIFGQYIVYLFVCSRGCLFYSLVCMCILQWQDGMVGIMWLQITVLAASRQ